MTRKSKKDEDLDFIGKKFKEDYEVRKSKEIKLQPKTTSSNEDNKTKNVYHLYKKLDHIKQNCPLLEMKLRKGRRTQ